jgi:hypothetical protein
VIHTPPHLEFINTESTIASYLYLFPHSFEKRIVYWKNDVIRRNNDLPAIDGDYLKVCAQNGTVHREDGKPGWISNHSGIWYKHGLICRENSNINVLYRDITSVIGMKREQFQLTLKIINDIDYISQYDSICEENHVATKGYIPWLLKN